MKNMTLYHKDIRLPNELKNLGTIKFVPVYSRHALEAANTDRYGLIKLPSSVTFNGSNIVEAEVEDGCKKLVIRVAYNDRLDIIIVFIPETLVVKTVWFNAKNDKHYTLDRSEYSTR
jgi:hypothetical protein